MSCYQFSLMFYAKGTEEKKWHLTVSYCRPWISARSNCLHVIKASTSFKIIESSLTYIMASVDSSREGIHSYLIQMTSIYPLHLKARYDLGVRLGHISGSVYIDKAAAMRQKPNMCWWLFGHPQQVCNHFGSALLFVCRTENAGHLGVWQA